METHPQLYLDPNRVNRPFVLKPQEQGLFEEEIARVKGIFKALEEDQRRALEAARANDGDSVQDRIHRAQAIEGWSSGSNIIGIFGKRGSGKTSMMLNVMEALRDQSAAHTFRKSGSPLGNFLTIWLDPALFMNNCLADVFLAKMYGMFKDWYDEDCSRTPNRSEPIEKELHAAFQRVQRAFGGVRGGNSKEYTLQNLLVTSEANTIQRNVFELVEWMLKARGCAGGKLVLMVDDFDLQEQHVLDHLEDWKSFLNLPNVIVVLSTAQEELEELLVVGRMKDRMPPLPIEWIGKRELFERAHAYLLKVVAPNRRVYIAPNKAKDAEMVIYFGEQGREVKRTIQDHFVGSIPLELGIHFYFLQEERQLIKKISYDLGMWRDSSLREQVIAMTQLLDGSKSALLDANFTQSEIHELERALPSRAERLKFTSNAVRWITTDRNAKNGVTLKSFCKRELGIEMRSNWQAFLFLNHMWTLLGDDGHGEARLINFLDVSPEAEMQFWGGPSKLMVASPSKKFLEDLADPGVQDEAWSSRFLAELMVSEYWYDGKEWKLQQSRRDPMMNPINAIPRLLIGWEEPFDLRAPKTFTQNDDSAVKKVHTEFSEWHKKLRASGRLQDLEGAISNPIFFSSLLSRFSKGSAKRAAGVEGFFQAMTEMLVTHLEAAFEAGLVVRDSKNDENANEEKQSGVMHGSEKGAELYSNIRMTLESHPFRNGLADAFMTVIEKAMKYNQGREEEEGVIVEQHENLVNKIGEWKRYLRYLYSKRDGFLPAAWGDAPEPQKAGIELRKRARLIQVYLSREVHRQRDVNPLGIYSELNNAIRLAGESQLLEAAGRVYQVIQSYITFLEDSLKKLESQLEELRRKETAGN